MVTSFQVRGESGLDTVIELRPRTSKTIFNGTDQECARGPSSYSLINDDHLNLNDDGSFTNTRTREVLRRILGLV